jgi:hypothetical protein
MCLGTQPRRSRAQSAGPKGGHRSHTPRSGHRCNRHGAAFHVSTRHHPKGLESGQTRPQREAHRERCERSDGTSSGIRGELGTQGPSLESRRRCVSIHFDRSRTWSPPVICVDADLLQITTMNLSTSERESSFAIPELDLYCTGTFKIKTTAQMETNIRLHHGERFQTTREVSTSPNAYLRRAEAGSPSSQLYLNSITPHTT